MNKKIFIFALLIILLVQISGFSQNYRVNIETEVSGMLLTKDLATAVKEVESSNASDLNSLVRQMIIYRRAGNFQKVSAAVRQIINHPDFKDNSLSIESYLQHTFKNDFFTDAETLRLYMQKSGFIYQTYEKLAELCTKNRSTCDFRAFDEWLARRYADYPESEDWVNHRIDWRKRFGLSTEEILNDFAQDVRKNPSDLKAAARYLKFFNEAQQIQWLADTFSSKQAFEYYDLGNRIAHSTVFRSTENLNEIQQIRRIGISLLLKSLTIPFNENDKKLISKHYMMNASISPEIENYEKQLRYWTKTSLAENYKSLGEAHNAQPLIEELVKMDKSDISVGDPHYLAGQVQSASGMRMVESGILQEEGARNNSYEYWNQRIAYYYGRNEPESVFNSFLQAFTAVPFAPDENSVEQRLWLIRRFADLVGSKFGSNLNGEESEEWSDTDKKKYRLAKEAEKFLRAEYERNRAQIKYSFNILSIADMENFDNLTNEILSKDSVILVEAAKSDLFVNVGNLVTAFLTSEKIPQTKKQKIFADLMKTAEIADLKKSHIILAALLTDGSEKYLSFYIPIFEKKLKESRMVYRRIPNSDDDNNSDEDDDNYGNWSERYADLLFKANALSGNRQAAFKLLKGGEFDGNDLIYKINDLIQRAVSDKAFNEAFLYYQTRGNIDRTYLESLSYWKNFPVFTARLRAFYRQMKTAEPFSPVPDAALEFLK